MSVCVCMFSYGYICYVYMRGCYKPSVVFLCFSLPYILRESSIQPGNYHLCKSGRAVRTLNFPVSAPPSTGITNTCHYAYLVYVGAGIQIQGFMFVQGALYPVSCSQPPHPNTFKFKSVSKAALLSKVKDSSQYLSCLNF